MQPLRTFDLLLVLLCRANAPKRLRPKSHIGSLAPRLYSSPRAMALLLTAAVSAASTSRLAEAAGRRGVTVNGSTPSLSTLMPHGSDPTPPRMGSVHAHRTSS